ncbi:MAG TPA: hypothetical protein VGK59_17110 [Ohtaekwangia sp.]
MKRLLAIFFLSVFLFNIGGYYLAFWSIRFHAKKELLSRLDAEQYNADELTVLAIPLSLPYPVQQSEYERVDGDFEYQGEFYKLVKQRIENDTLFVVCIKDNQEKKIEVTWSAYAKVANDLPTQSKQTLSLLAKLAKGYSPVPSFQLSRDFILQQENFSEKTYSILQKSYPIESPPPQVS